MRRLSTFTGKKGLGQKSKFHSVPYAMLLPAFLVLVTIVVYPLIFSLSMSLRDFSYTRPGSEKPFVGLSNFKSVLLDSEFLNSIKVNLLFCIGAVTLELLLGLGVALLFNRELPGFGVLRSLILIPMIITPVVVGLIWRWLLNPQLGLINYLLGCLGINAPAWLSDTRFALPSLILVDVWEWTPFVFLTIYASLQSLPEEPYEAALIDGASAWQTFRYITLPSIWPSMLVVSTIRFMDTIRVFDIIYITTMGGPGTATEVLSLYPYRQIFYFNSISKAAASSLLILIITIIISRILFDILVRTQEV